MKPGRELDKLVWKYVVKGEPLSLGLGFCPSTDVGDAMFAAKELIKLCGDFHGADGFWKLVYADSACHDDGEGCKPVDVQAFSEDLDEEDEQRWSCHFHLGLLGSERDFPPGWEHSKTFCHRGETAAHAICLAALLAVGHPVTIHH